MGTADLHTELQWPRHLANLSVRVGYCEMFDVFEFAERFAEVVAEQAESSQSFVPNVKLDSIHVRSQTE